VFPAIMVPPVWGNHATSVFPSQYQGFGGMC